MCGNIWAYFLGRNSLKSCNQMHITRTSPFDFIHQIDVFKFNKRCALAEMVFTKRSILYSLDVGC